MRRTGFIALSVAALIITMSPQATAASPGERVVGGFSQEGARVIISASGDPASEAATGLITNMWPGDYRLAYTVRVTCMAIVGRFATIGGEITASDYFPGHVGSGLVFYVADGGNPGVVGDQASHSLDAEPQPLPGADCPDPYAPGWPITGGNVLVLGG